MRWVRSLLIVGLLALACGPRAWAASPLEVHAAISPDRIGLNEIATFTITASAHGFAGLDLEPDFKLDDLETVAGPFRTESVRFVNGLTSRSLSLSWQLHPLHSGTARVRSIVVKARGRRIELPDQTIQIENTATLHPGSRGNQGLSPFGSLMQPFSRSPAPFAPPPSPPRTMPEVFLQAVASPAAPYVGQQVLYTLYLYTQGDVDNIDPEEIPDFHGFWAKEVPQPSHLQPHMVTLHNQRFGRVALLRRALFPLHSGQLEIGVAKARLTLSVPAGGAFGSLFEHTVEVKRAASPIALSVRSLPPAPADFDGAIGSLAIRASLTPHKIKLGDAATLTVTLAGFGHVKGLSPPTLPRLPGLEIYPPQSESNDSLVGTRVRESLTWTYVLVPKRSARWKIPPIAISYFDPEAGSYATTKSAPTELAAIAGPAPPQAATSRRESRVTPNHSTGVEGLTGALALSPWRWGGLIFVLLIVGSTVAYFRRRARSMGGKPGKSELERRYLARFAAILLDGSPRRSAIALEQTWREFLDERWAVPMGTPIPRWAPFLRKRGADAEATEELAQLADDLHFLRYAPQLSATDALGGELIERSKRLLARLA